LFKFVRESDQASFRCELRDRGRWGCEARFLFNGRLLFSRRFDTKEQAAQWAALERDLVDEIKTEGHRWFRPDGDVFIPLEFADAAYRCGHCQIRHAYQLNVATKPVPTFPDLLGFRAVPPELTVDCYA
jgi:hypothetical protein